MSRILLMVLIGMTLAGCGGASPVANSSTSEAAPSVSATAVPSIAPPTLTPGSTMTPTVVESREQASTSLPTSTATPTSTPAPAIPPTVTTAPTPIAATAEPQVQQDSQAHDTAELGPNAAPTAAPTTVAEAAQTVPSEPVRLVIEAIGLDRALVAVGLDASLVPVVPNHDVGWYNLSAMPGQGENIVFWGHVLRFRSTPNIPAPFARLKEAQVGDTVVIYSADGSAHTYAISEQIWATPDQVDYILPRGRELVTLVSCIGDKVVVEDSVEMTHRLITIAEPVR